MCLLSPFVASASPAAADGFTPSIKKATHDGEWSWVYYFDDSATVLMNKEKSVEISEDDGGTWTKVTELAGYEVLVIHVHPYVKERAVAFAKGNAHFVTNNRGKTWSKFEIHGTEHLDSISNVILSYNLKLKDLILFEITVCRSGFFMPLCTSMQYYTEDAFKTNPKQLSGNPGTCVYVYANADFQSDVPDETVVCSRNEENSYGHTTKSQLLVSSDYFKTNTIVDHPILKSGKIIGVRIDSAFIVALAQKDKFDQKSEVLILVSKDAKTFDLANLEIQMEYGAVVFLESSPLALFLSVMRPKTFTQGESTMYRSDSTGLKFTSILEHMQPFSVVKAQYVEGVWFTSILSDSSDLVNTPFGTQTIFYNSKVSIDNGDTWKLLEIVDDDNCRVKDGCSLHFFLAADVEANDKLVTGPTPNIMVVYGSAGKGKLDLNLAKTYVSRDGGLTWREAIDEPTIFTFADQGNIIAAVARTLDSDARKPADQLYFSLDQGRLFQTLQLDTPIIPERLVTTLDGSSSRVLLVGSTSQNEQISYAVDFGDAFGGAKCGEGDFDVVSARLEPGAREPICIRGHKEKFKRRKQDAQCLVKMLFEDVHVQEEPCSCTVADFECAQFFELSEKKTCIPNFAQIGQYCKQRKAKKVTLPHKQLQSGNMCVSGDKNLDDFIAKTEFDCTNLGAPSDENNSTSKERIRTGLSKIPGQLLQYLYVSAGSGVSDNILVNTDSHYAYASNDGGYSFVKIPIGEQTESFAVGPVPGSVVLATYESIYYSLDGGNYFTKYRVPGPPSISISPVTFHPKDPRKFMYYTGVGCGSFSGVGCTVYETIDGGETFKALMKDSGRCEYVGETFGSSAETIFCALSNGEGRKLVSSLNLFADTSILYENIVDFALRSKFVFVATIAEDKKLLEAKVTGDGITFADADFPTDFSVDVQTGYTILELGTQSLFLHVTTDKSTGHEVGTILKSNSNGTFYILSLPEVNRNSIGYVDFDRVDIIEGMLLANVVTKNKKKKELQTRISFNEGSEWHYLAPPKVDSNNKKYPCSGVSLLLCALHLQGFTERPDYRDTFLSALAVGFLIGVGNVGEYLGSTELATFFSSDGGVTWKEIRKGSYMWEYGDKGTILLLVDAVNPTQEVIYSTDDGNTWSTHQFSDAPVQIWDLATVPTDTARKFVIFAGEKGNVKLDTQVFSLDFTHFYERQCQLDLDHPQDDDFDYWTARHPEAADNCLFGRETKYLRRAAGKNDCFIGASPLDEGSIVVKNCLCTRRDYECDYNYYADNDGTCKLVPGLSPQDRLTQMCAKNGTFQYFEPTGYRKIPLSSCVGGKSYDSWNARPCPGHEKEFDDYHGTTMGWGTWLALVFIPLAVFAAALWFVYEKGIRRNGGFERLGLIRLDDDDFSPIEENSVDVVVNRIVRGGIVVAAGVIAVFKTVLRIDRRFADEIKRMLFGRPGRRSYVRIPDDEDTLFGNFEDFDEADDTADNYAFDVQLDPEIFEEFVDEPPADSRLFDIDDDSRDDPEPELES